jgi:hypothetical protein
MPPENPESLEKSLEKRLAIKGQRRGLAERVLGWLFMRGFSVAWEGGFGLGRAN